MPSHFPAEHAPRQGVVPSFLAGSWLHPLAPMTLPGLGIAMFFHCILAFVSASMHLSPSSSTDEPWTHLLNALGL